ncbi:unnamed protein product [Heligmosomoides polygyrus]|uniref:NR LBD domain-containing protein n=1 Tax=Heligmosomoides polygyrus TaxID=6339 RepID=A0A183F875_HELPZ|nr:unnamed protein product [Heligmosomoides polygyrus]
MLNAESLLKKHYEIKHLLRKAEDWVVESERNSKAPMELKMLQGVPLLTSGALQLLRYLFDQSSMVTTAMLVQRSNEMKLELRRVCPALVPTKHQCTTSPGHMSHK